MRYKVLDQFGIQFLTFTVVDWCDVFTRKAYKEIIIESLRYCQEHKGLVSYAYVIMTNHLHLVVRAQGEVPISNIIRDFKRFTGTQLINAVQENQQESRRDWLLHRFAWNAKRVSGNRQFQFWKADNHPFLLYSPQMIWQKINYIHYNPVVAGIVKRPEDYIYSSASNYEGQGGVLEVTLMEPYNPIGYVHLER